MKKRHKTAFHAPYGRAPLRDARVNEEVGYILSEESAKKGSKNRPAACAVALDNRVNRKLFPGKFLGSWVYKTHTHVATQIGGGIRYIRFVHSEPQRLAINGFDASTKKALKAGDKVELLAPTGYKRLGANNGTPGPSEFKAKKPRSMVCGRKRGVFVSPEDTAAARADADNKTTFCEK